MKIGCLNTHVDFVHNLIRVLGYESALSSNVDIALGNKIIALWHRRTFRHVLCSIRYCDQPSSPRDIRLTSSKGSSDSGILGLLACFAFRGASIPSGPCWPSLVKDWVFGLCTPPCRRCTTFLRRRTLRGDGCAGILY